MRVPSLPKPFMLSNLAWTSEPFMLLAEGLLEGAGPAPMFFNLSSSFFFADSALAFSSFASAKLTSFWPRPEDIKKQIEKEICFPLYVQESSHLNTRTCLRH